MIFLHRITDNRIAGSHLKHVNMFSNLCGQMVMPDVVIATTMWSDVNPAIGISREIELKRIYGDILPRGCRVERFEDTYESAWLIIDRRQKMLEEQTAKVAEAVDIKQLPYDTFYSDKNGSMLICVIHLMVSAILKTLKIFLQKIASLCKLNSHLFL
jgi:hypothetical protein